MTDKIKQLREEWLKSDFVEKLGHGVYTLTNDTPEEIADFWISKMIAREEEIKGKIEELAELEHEQWMYWAINISETENIKPERMERWKRLCRPYSELNEEQKEQDRVWARKTLSLLTKE